MDQHLESIVQVADSLVENLEQYKSIPKDTIEGSRDGISLLSLKNHAMLSYLHNATLLAATHVARSQQDVENLREKAVKGTITQRVALEKGVKGLEAKMSYQIEKVLRANIKAKELKEKAEREDGSSDDDDDEDALRHRPNPRALLGKRDNDKEEDKDGEPAKYQPPKITAVTPFGKDHNAKASRRQRNATMEEFLKHSSDAPIAEPSIGSTIMDHGRGGERTERDRKKMDEVKKYEESNFTRLNVGSKKEEKRAARKRQRDATGKYLGGEDWGFIDNRNPGAIEKATKRRDKPSSVWERTKKRQRQG